MAGWHLIAALCLTICVLICTNVAFGQVLTPPYFNLAVNRRIIASSTCGEDVPEPELFCKLTGANLARGSFARHRDSEEEDLIIQGQLCDHCDPRQKEKRHPAVNAIDGTEHWWQSPPLSRGLHYNEVNLTIDLGQVSVVIIMS